MLDQLNLMEVNVFGAVLNCVPQKQTYYFDERIEDIGKKHSETPDRLKTGGNEKGGSPKESGKLDGSKTPL